MKLVAADQTSLNRDGQNPTGVVLELAESVTKLRVTRELLETLVVSPVMLVHGLVNEHCEIETDKEVRARCNRNALKAAAIVAPAMAEVRH